jgi:hypothetical protein
MIRPGEEGLMTAASAGGSAGARGVGLQDLVFAWAATALVAERGLPYVLLPGRVERVGAQTGFAMDDVAVHTDEGAFGLFQVKAGLGLGGEGSPLDGAVEQAVRQHLSGLLPDEPGARRVEPGRDVLAICTDSSAPNNVREHLSRAVERAATQPPGTELTHELTHKQTEALVVLLAHARRHWAGYGHGDPGVEELRTFLRLLRFVTIDASPGRPDHVSSVLTLGSVVPAGKAEDAWRELVAQGHSASERRIWLDRDTLSTALLAAGVSLAAPSRHRADVDVLRSLSARNLVTLAAADELPIADGLHVPRGSAAALEAAVRSGHVLLVGDAGVGKTGMAARLARDLSGEQDVLMLQSSDVAGANRTQVCRPISEVLLGWTGPPAVLVVDGFDALRGGDDRAFLVRVVRDLAGSRWTVLMTVRTFEAHHSTDLRDLFAGPPASTDVDQIDRRLAGVRHLRVDDLTDAELDFGLPPSLPLTAFLTATPGMRRLLRNPFNLRLAAKMFADGAPAGRAAMGGVQTRLDLLDAYWEHRVDSGDVTARSALLTRLSRRMTDDRDLKTLETEPTVVAADGPAVEGLLRENVLSQHPGALPGGRRVLTFAHNILFDYAVARYVLLNPVDPARLLDELDRDPALPLVARPSLDLLVDRLWQHRDDVPFWPAWLEVAGSPHVLASLAFAGRLISLVSDPDDLQPLATAMAGADEAWREAARTLTYHLVVRSRRFPREARDPSWSRPSPSSRSASPAARGRRAASRRRRSVRTC